MKTLNELNTEIQRLQEQRQEILNREKLQEEQAIQNLQWTKDYKAKLEVSPLHGAGLPKYTIMVFGDPPSSISPVCVMGNHALCQFNMLYGKDFASQYSSFYTSNTELLIEFLKEVQFKELEFDREHLRVLEAAKEAVNNEAS